MRDAALLMTWRNDALTLAMSGDSRPVTWDGHAAWLAGKLADPDVTIVIAEIEGAYEWSPRERSDFTPVGVIRAEHGELHWTVAPKHRGKRYGSAMVQAFVGENGPAWRARIKPENVASLATARRAGIRQIASDIAA